MRNSNPAQKDIGKPSIGILEWFQVNDYDHVNRTIEKLKILGIKELRTGISWADYFTPDGEKWYDWLVPKLADNFELLPCFHCTPPSMGITGKPSSPLKNSKDLADFLDLFIGRYGACFEYVELWNEPNNRGEYDYFLDPNWDIFAKMIIQAANWSKKLGKKTVLGGISPIDPAWLKIMGEKKVLDYIDIVGIHGFPDVFDSLWKSWDESIESIQCVIDEYNNKIEIWITETGYSTWRFDDRKQIEKFINVLQTHVKKVFWYALYDISARLPSIDDNHMDERENHFGMINQDGIPKLLFRLWATGGIKNILKNKWIIRHQINGEKSHKKPVMITGGAGFIGTNLAHRLLKLGYPVYIYDNLSRAGVESNLKWLKEHHKENLTIVVADVRDEYALQNAVKHVSHIFHLAGQVSVTTSFENPVLDYSINVGGTLNVLETIRKSEHKPSLIFTSTNKVYGNLNDIHLNNTITRYFAENEKIRNKGLSELRHLDFLSPYGSSKGAADQYVLDYARSYGLNNVVFRTSCIYGKHQFGTEDQGWVAHFILKALKKERITIFGDGMQVRDILFVEDLVEAFLFAWEKIETFRGEVFNIGGGTENSISLIELIQMIENITGKEVPLKFEDWRRGDQKYYISDISKFKNLTGWSPTVNVVQGVTFLYDWLKRYNRSFILMEPVEEQQL